MGEDADRRGVETLPPVPPRHATGLERFHLRLSKTEHLAACAIFKSDTQSEGRARARPDAATPTEPFFRSERVATRCESSNGSAHPKRSCSSVDPPRHPRDCRRNPWWGALSAR